MTSRTYGREWVRLDVDFHGHPKALKVGAVGRDFFLALVSESSKYRLDGEVPLGLALSVAGSLNVEGPFELLDRLVEVGFLDRRGEDGWKVHDFAEWQTTKAEREAETDRARARRERFKAKRAADGTRRERVSTATEGETEEEGEEEGER